MKKVFVTILAVIYLATSSGASITMHYCMGKLSSIDFVSNDKCTKCGMKNAKGCCTDEVKVIKAQDNHQLNPQMNLPASFAILHTGYNIYTPASFAIAPTHTTHNNSPPGSGTSLYILNCVFRL